jgi:cytidylate kinase
MAANVICIARALFTEADEIADAIAAEMGFRCVDQEILERAAQRHNVPPAELASVERRKSYLTMLMQDVAEGGAEILNYIANPKAAGTSDDMREIIRQAILETAEEGNVVIVAHAASFALARRKKTLRVLVTGSEFARVNRWLLTAGGRSPREITDAIRESDKGRANYLKRFYDIDHESPEHYDLTLTIDALPMSAIQSLIVSAARAID